MKKRYIFLTLTLCFFGVINTNGQTWTQVGADIDGEAANDYSGQSVSLSSDGSTMAIGAHANDGTGSNAGHVRVYKNISGTWTQVGADIDGEAANDYSGFSVSLSSDGSTVAIGAYANDGTGTQAGHVRIYKNISGTWTQVGADIDGEAAGDRSGFAVSLSSDGSIVAIGANYNDGTGSNAGHVRIYKNISGTWTQVGADIDGEAADDFSGFSVSLSSDGSTVAIGATSNDGNGSYAGHVRIYKNISGTWTQVGADIDGEAASDRSGVSVSLSSDGNIVAIGADANDGNGSYAGHVRIYQNISGTWTQVGADIDGEAAGDYSGQSVSLSSDGSIVAIGAKYNDGNGSNAGHVRVYNTCITTYSTDIITSCGAYTWTNGVTYTTSNSTATYTFVNAAGCDSIVTLNLSIVSEHDQVGADIDGEATYDYSGWSVSLSSDGSTLAIGAYANDGNGSHAGHVRVYQNISGTWTQVGADIDGEAKDDQSGYSVSLSSDGSTVAIGAPYNDGTGSNSGHVRIYKNISGTWTQVGADIDGEAARDRSGHSVSLSSDGSTLAIGAYRNDGNGSYAGHVRVYQNISGTWTQVGADIDGEAAGDYSGYSVSLSSDGSTVAIGAIGNDGTGSYAGHVRVYKNISGTWTQVGADIDGEAAGDNSGWSVSLSSDGSIVAIAAHYNDGNGLYAGHVRIYKNISGTWTQVGADIDGEAADDHSGVSVSLSSDGSIVAIGADYNDGDGSYAGHVRIYKNISGTWTQVGADIDGEAAGDESGYSVSLSSDGSTVAIGARYNDGTGSDAGHVRVYNIASIATYSTDIITSCGAYTWTNGVTYTTSNSTATDTFVNAAGCDSIVSLNLTVDIIKPTVVTQNLTVSLDASGSGSITATQVDNGSTDNCTIATRTLSTSSFDCSNLGNNTIWLRVTDVNGNVDSASAVITVQDVIKPTVVTQNLTVSLDAAGSGSITATQVDNGSTDNCTISTRTLSTSSFDCSNVGANTVYLIVTDVNGNVDSASAVITVQDIIKPTVVTTPSNIALGYCDAAYTYPLPTATDNCGVTVTQVAGLASGSVFPIGITTNTFEIKDPSDNTVTTSFTVDIRDRYMPFDTTNMSLCQNDAQIDLSRGYTNLTFTGQGIEPDEITFNPIEASSGNYLITRIFIDSMGCISKDSIKIEVRSISNVPIIDRVASDKIITSLEYNTYQWYRNGTALEGKTEQLLRVYELGIYSVVVGNTEKCFTNSEGYGFGIPVNEEQITNQGTVKVYPNPTEGLIFIEMSDGDLIHNLSITNGLGVEVLTQVAYTSVARMDMSSLSPGTYFLQITSASTNASIKLVKM
jgi:hypothetical protein